MQGLLALCHPSQAMLQLLYFSHKTLSHLSPWTGPGVGDFLTSRLVNSQ